MSRPLGLAAALVLVGTGIAVPVEVARAEEAAGELALEPIGGYTDLGNVRVLTTGACPGQSTSVIVRISGAGFLDDTNVIGNTELRLVQRTPDGTGYVVPIFADWEYLASTHDAHLPLSGPARLTLLCADADLERIDARMEGNLRFDATPGQMATYQQEGGPRLATGLPGIPPPGSGGVPEDAPTADPPPASVELIDAGTAATGDATAATAADDAAPPDEAVGGAEEPEASADEDASAPGGGSPGGSAGGSEGTGDAVPTASDAADDSAGSSAHGVALAFAAASAVLAGTAGFVAVRRRRTGMP